MGHLSSADLASLAQAQAHLRAGESPQAEAIYRQVLETDPACA
jgi:hypothetical protein